MHTLEADKALADQFAFGLEGTPAAQPESDLSAADLADLSYHRKKVSGELQRQRDHWALEDQVQFMRSKGAL